MAYKYESLPSANQSPRDNFGDYAGVVDTIMVHHWGIDGQLHRRVVAWLRGEHGNTSNRGSSAHYVTSANLVSQLVPESQAAWHCVGRNGGTIGVECRPEKSKGDWRTLVELCADIEERRGSMKYDWHGNNSATSCPGRYRRKINKLVRDVNKELKRRGKATAKAQKKAKVKPSKSSGYTGSSVVDYLNSVGRSSSFNARAALAREYGISGYRGTSQQNLLLLDRLRGGSSSATATKSVNTMATEVIRGDHGKGHSTRRKSLGISRKLYKDVRAAVNNRLR